jgi:hypothetical protein
MKKVLMGCGVSVVALVVIAGGALGFFYYKVNKLKDPPAGAFPSQVGQFRLSRSPEPAGVSVTGLLQGSGVWYTGAEYTSPRDESVGYGVRVYGSPEKAYKAMLEERDRLVNQEHGSLIPQDVLASRTDPGIVIDTRSDRFTDRHVLWLRGSWLCEADSEEGSAAQDFQQSIARGGVNSSNANLTANTGGAGTVASDVAGAGLASSSAGGNPPQGRPPIYKAGLVTALKVGGFTAKELAAQIKERGVAFRMTSTDEAELRAAGADDEIIAAVRDNYRPTSNAGQ